MGVSAALFLALAAPEVPDCVNARTTPEINACAAADLADSQARLDRYLAAAHERLERNDNSPAVLQELNAAQATWASYRDAECGAVYTNWSSGTIRGLAELTCRIALTDQRTHTVWQNWLTYMDSTAPLLPEPGPTPSRGAVED